MDYLITYLYYGCEPSYITANIKTQHETKTIGVNRTRNEKNLRASIQPEDQFKFG